jgi:hypothetical protein
VKNSITMPLRIAVLLDSGQVAVTVTTVFPNPNIKFDWICAFSPTGTSTVPLDSFPSIAPPARDIVHSTPIASVPPLFSISAVTLKSPPLTFFYLKYWST